MKIFIFLWLLAVLMMLNEGVQPVQAHPKYTPTHIDRHMAAYQKLIGQQANANRVLREKLRQQRSLKSSFPRVFSMRTVKASWYGPGFYGGTTANGTHYTQSTWGLAHKSKPFGTRCLIRYGNKSVVAPVIDRGPYSGDREFDLSGAVKVALGFNGVQIIKVRCW